MVLIGVLLLHRVACYITTRLKKRDGLGHFKGVTCTCRSILSTLIVFSPSVANIVSQDGGQTTNIKVEGKLHHTQALCMHIAILAYISSNGLGPAVEHL